MALVKKHNYRDLPNTKNRALYQKLSPEARDDFRASSFVRGNKNSHPKAADDVCEEHNLREKSLPPAHTVAAASKRSEHLPLLHQSRLVLDGIAGLLDEDDNRINIRQSIPTSVLNGRKVLAELIEVSELFAFKPGPVSYTHLTLPTILLV